MLEIGYILILLVIINFYLRFRLNDRLNATQKFMISLMSIFLLFFLFYATAYFWGAYLDQHRQNKLMSPMFINTVFVVMNFVMPIITTEIILAGYSRFVLNKRDMRP